MEVQIGNYVIYGGKHSSFDLYKRYISQKGKSKGQEVETIVGYYHDLEDALKALVREDILRSKATSLKEVINIIKLTKAEIDSSIGIKNVRRTRKEVHYA